MSEVKYAISILKEKLANADWHNLAYQRLSVAEMEAIWGTLEKSDKDYAELKAQRDALAAENAALLDFDIDEFRDAGPYQPDDSILGKLKTPATDAYLNSVRAEGIHFAANRILAAWDAGFIDDTPAQVYDITGAVLSALELLADASPGEFKRDFADEIRSGIAAQLRVGEPS